MDRGTGERDGKFILYLVVPVPTAGDDVCGVSVRIRGFDQNVIQIWNQDSEMHSKSSVREGVMCTITIRIWQLHALLLLLLLVGHTKNQGTDT